MSGIVAGAAALGLVGCANSSSLNEVLATGATKTTAAGQTITQGRPLSQLSMVSVPPIVVTPAGTASAVQAQDQLMRQLNTAATRHDIALIAAGGGETSLTLRGYVLAIRDKSGVKVTQIWDVLDGGGQRVNRSVREQTLTDPNPSGDIWVSASRIDTQAMADMAIEALKGAGVRTGVGTAAQPIPPKPVAAGAPAVALGSTAPAR